MKSKSLWLVCGATWPFRSTLHESKRSAMACAAQMRRDIRVRFPESVAGRPRDLGIVIEPRSPRDMF